MLKSVSYILLVNKLNKLEKIFQHRRNYDT